MLGQRLYKEDFSIPHKEKKESFGNRFENAITARTNKRHQLYYDNRKKRRGFITYAPINFAIMNRTILDATKPNAQMYAVQLARKIFCSELEPPIYEMLDAGILVSLLQCLDAPNNKYLNFEAITTIHCLAPRNEYLANMIITAGAIPKLIQMLSWPELDILEYVVYTLEILVVTVPTIRQEAIDYGIVELLLTFVNMNTHIPFLISIVEILMNLCQKSDVMSRLDALVNSSELQLVKHAVWGLAYMSDDDCEYIELMIRNNLVQRLIHLLSFDCLKIHTAVVHIIGNIACCHNSNIKYLLQCGVLPYIKALIPQYKKPIRRHIIWCVSNLLCGNEFQIQLLIDMDIVHYVIKTLRSASLSTRIEAAFALTNACFCGSRTQLSYLTNGPVIAGFCQLLDCDNELCVRSIVLCLRTMFIEFEQDRHNIATTIRQSNGLQKLEQLLKHREFEIYDTAFSVINFCEEEECLQHLKLGNTNPTIIDAQQTLFNGKPKQE